MGSDGTSVMRASFVSQAFRHHRALAWVHVPSRATIPSSGSERGCPCASTIAASVEDPRQSAPQRRGDTSSPSASESERHDRPTTTLVPGIDEATRLIGVEAAGQGLATGKHAASLSAGSPGVLHGNRTYLLQDANGQIVETHSISAGLDYPGVGPEHAYLKDIGRAEYVGISDDEALQAFHRLCRTEGIIPALESSHAVAQAIKMAPSMRPDQYLLVNLSGRGDKDIGTVADLSGAQFYCRPSCRGQSVKGADSIVKAPR